MRIADKASKKIGWERNKVMLLFGIGHKARQGKDSFGAYLAEQHGFRVYHYADQLKKEAQIAGWNPDNKNELAHDVIKRAAHELTDPLAKEVVIWYNTNPVAAKNAHHLTFLQWFGTEFRRAQDSEYWVKTTFQQIRADANHYNHYRACICDMRFVNELLAVKREHGYTFDIRRWRETRTLDSDGYWSPVLTPYIDDERDPDHPSEVELDGVPHDFTIWAKDLKELYRQADNIIKYLEAGGTV